MDREMTTQQESKSLTAYPLGSFREFLSISIPLILLLLSGSFIGLCDRLFLSRYSIEALEACTSTLSLCALFQLPAVRVVSIIQAFIGKYKGEGDLQKIGACVWQMIWLSVFIFLIALPLGLFAEHFFFKNTSIASLGIPYFRILLFLNLLLPLGASLSSFYVGQGRTKTVLYATLCSHAIHLILDPLLIFGLKGVTPSFGIQGAAVATVVSQLVYCGILFYCFLKTQNRQIYGSGNYFLNPSLFWEYLRIGVSRSLSRVIILINWATVVRMLTLKGGIYLLAFSFGGSIHLLFSFVIDGMGQAIVTIGSYIIGAKNLPLIRKLIKSIGWLIFSTMLLLSIPYLIYPDMTISFIFPNLQDAETLRILRYCCYWSFLFFFAQALNSIGHNLLTAFQDTFFQMVYSGISSWFVSYGMIFYMVEICQCSPDKIWLATSAACLIATLVYLIRVKYIKERMEALELSQQIGK
jgi:MATE family multidrug resistance protein